MTGLELAVSEWFCLGSKATAGTRRGAYNALGRFANTGGYQAAAVAFVSGTRRDAARTLIQFADHCHQQGAAPKSISTYTACIMGLATHLHRCDVIAWNLHGALPKRPRAQPVNPRRGPSMGKLNAALRDAPRETYYDRLAWHAIHFAAHTGLRVGELVQVGMTNIDWQKCTVLVIRKGHTVPTPIPVSSKALAVLRTWFNQNESVGLAFPYGIRRVQHLVQHYFKRIGLPGLALHNLRHTFATHMARVANTNALGTDAVMVLTGHRTVSALAAYIDDVDVRARALLDATDSGNLPQVRDEQGRYAN